MNLAHIQPAGGRRRRRHLVTRKHHRVYGRDTIRGAQHQTSVQSFFVLLSFSAFRAGPRSTTPPNPRDSKHAQYTRTRRRFLRHRRRRVNNIILYIYTHKRFAFTRSRVQRTRDGGV